MNVLHFNRTMRAEDGGVVKAVLDLCATTAGEDADITVATVDPGAVPGSWIAGDTPHLRVERLPSGGKSLGRLDSAQADRLRTLIRDADVVHLHSMWGMANIQAASICRSLGKPYVLSVHGMLDDWCMSQRRLKKVLFLKTLNRSLVANASAIHCTAQAELDQAARWIPEGRGVVVPLPLDFSPFETIPEASEASRMLQGIDPTVPVVLFLSRIHYKKGLDRLIEACGILRRRSVPHHLVVAGTGEGDYPARMEALTEQRGIQDTTSFVGFVAGREKVALLAHSDVFALATSQENFGFVYFESLAAGTPVLTTRGTDTWPELESSGGAVIVDNSPEAFADALERMLADRGKLASMGSTGRSWVMEYLGTEAIRAGYTDLYERLMEAPA